MKSFIEMNGKIKINKSQVFYKSFVSVIATVGAYEFRATVVVVVAYESGAVVTVVEVVSLVAVVDLACLFDVVASCLFDVVALCLFDVVASEYLFDVDAGCC